MNLRVRLGIVGAALPALGFVLAIAWGGHVFSRELLNDLDRRLLAQAAVESVSLFDRPTGAHVHVSASPLFHDVLAFAPTTALYGPDLRRVVVFPERSSLPARWAAGPPTSPRFDTDAAGRWRTLATAVPREAHGTYTLVMRASLAPLKRTVSQFYLRAGIGAGAILALLGGAVLWQSSQLARRVRALGRLASRESPSASAPGDEIDQLHAILHASLERARATDEARERFLANAAHQLRTPLGVLRTELDLALRRPREHADLVEVLGRARESVKHLGLLANSLLDYEAVHLQSLSARPVDLVPVVADVAERLATAARERDVVITVEGPETAWVRGDALWLAQALSNVVHNAIKHAPAGSAVRLRITHDAREATVTVSDEGPGIAPALRRRALEPFARGEQATEGVGLGLAIASEVAKRHGGRLSLRDAETASGLCVELTLPSGAQEPRN